MPGSVDNLRREAENLPAVKACYKDAIDLVLLISAISSTGIIIATILSILLRDFIINKFLFPLLFRLYPPQLVWKHDPINFLNLLFTAAIPLSIILSFLLLGYGLIWHYFSLYLPDLNLVPRSWRTKCISRWEVIGVLITILFALVPRVYSLTRGLGYDEIFTTVFFVDADSIWKTISTYIAFNNHIACSLLAKFSQFVFGQSEWALRMPSLLLGLTSLFCFWIFVRRAMAPKLAILSIFCLALSPAHVEWSISVRGYSGMILFTILSSYLYLRILDYPSKLNSIAYVFANVVGIYFHLYSIFMVVVQALYLLYISVEQLQKGRSADNLSRRSFRTLWISFTAIIFSSLLCYGPVLPRLIYYVEMSRHGHFRIFFPLQVIELLAGYLWTPLAAVNFLVFVSGMICLWVSHPRETKYLTFLFLLPLLVAWLSRPADLHQRFFAFALPYYILFLAAGLLRIWYFVKGLHIDDYRHLAYAVLTMLVVMLISSWSFSSFNKMPDEGFREAARALKTDIRKQTALCLIGEWGWDKLIEYYAKESLFVPANLEELEDLTRTFSEVRCIVTPEMSSSHRELSEYLIQRAELRKFNVLIMLTYDKSRDL